MAKPMKNAPHLCTIFMVIAILGISLGFVFRQPLIPILLLLHTAIYEVYRTVGKSTKRASSILVAVLIAEIRLVLFDEVSDVAVFLGSEGEYIGGFWGSLGDLRIFGQTIIAVLAVVLVYRTRGVNTKWLAVSLIYLRLPLFPLLTQLFFRAYSNFLRISNRCS
jgi:hypothetical protein